MSDLTREQVEFQARCLLHDISAESAKAAYQAILDNDAALRQRIKELEGGMMHDHLVSQAQQIDTLTAKVEELQAYNLNLAKSSSESWDKLQACEQERDEYLIQLTIKDSQIGSLKQQLQQREEDLRIAMHQGGQARTELMLENQAQRARLARLEGALKFYADPQTYGLHGGASDRIMADHGTKAQAALATREQGDATTPTF